MKMMGSSEMNNLTKQMDEQFNWLMKNAERQRQAELQRERVKEGIRVDLDEARFRQALRFAGFSDEQINGEIQRQIKKGIAKPEPVADPGTAGKAEPEVKSGVMLVKPPSFGVWAEMLTDWLDGKLPQVVTIKSERFVVIEDGAAMKSERDGRIIRLAEQSAAVQGEQSLLPERVVTFDESEV